jgi:hypothetical protein
MAHVGSHVNKIIVLDEDYEQHRSLSRSINRLLYNIAKQITTGFHLGYLPFDLADNLLGECDEIEKARSCALVTSDYDRALESVYALHDRVTELIVRPIESDEQVDRDEQSARQREVTEARDNRRAALRPQIETARAATAQDRERQLAAAVEAARIEHNRQEQERTARRTAQREARKIEAERRAADRARREAARLAAWPRKQSSQWSAA